MISESGECMDGWILGLFRPHNLSQLLMLKQSDLLIRSVLQAVSNREARSDCDTLCSRTPSRWRGTYYIDSRMAR